MTSKHAECEAIAVRTVFRLLETEHGNRVAALQAEIERLRNELERDIDQARNSHS